MTNKRRMMIKLLSAFNGYKFMQFATHLYDSASGTYRMFKFVSAYNRLNEHSLVAYPVYMYRDHFHDKGSINNKITFATQTEKLYTINRD